MHKAPTSFNMELFEEIRQIIADVTFIEASDIHPDSDMADELEITPEARNLQEITKRLNTKYELELSTKELAGEVETVADLVNIVTDEVEY